VRVPRILLVLAAAVLGLGPTAATADTSPAPYAPLNRPGPPLSVPTAKLAAALQCTAGVDHAQRDPILLVPGTDLDPQPNFSWNYMRAFTAQHWPYCSVTLPGHAMGDIQVAGEYVVYALRTMAARAGRKVDVLGYSQGGMLPRWALRWWPDTRALVDDVVGLDPSNHGTLDAVASCSYPCPAADWQQATGSHFVTALNSGAETFAGIDYTVVFSHTDEIVVPNLDASGSSSLHTGGGHIANIAVQDICPDDTSEHLAMGSYDPVGYALAVDAFTHPGVASASRVPATVCAQPVQPGVDPSTFATDYADYLAFIAQSQSSAPTTASEPPLRCYVFATPPAGCVGRSATRTTAGGPSTTERAANGAALAATGSWDGLPVLGLALLAVASGVQRERKRQDLGGTGEA
jgi:triacylglycerol esterase/lipase EstA (alpha/beta hydrolase family)